jgi:MFS transporter, ACS family, tartrate transporter
VILWLPQLFETAGVPGSMPGYAAVIPYAIAAVAMVWWSRHSDRSGERVWHIEAASWVGFLGLAASAYLTAAPALSIAAITFGAAGMLAILPIFWTLPAARLNGRAAAGGIGRINAVGNIGGFAGPFALGWVKDATGRFSLGLLIVAGGVLPTGLMTLAIGHDRAAQCAGGETYRYKRAG